MYHPLSRNHLYTAYRVIVEFMDEYGKPHQSAGTGFFVEHLTKVFFISNRHLFEAGYSDIRKKDWTLSGIKIGGYDSAQAYFQGYVRAVNASKLPICFDEDVALLEFAELLCELPHSGEPIAPVKIDSDYLARPEYFLDLSPVDSVAFPGYPAWHDIDQYRPIMRSGTICSDPSIDFTGPSMASGVRRLAFDGFAYPGSSGSPVFTLDYGLRTEGGLTGGFFRPSKCIGLIAGHFKTADSLGAHSGVSYLMKSTVILYLLGAQQ